MGFWRRKHRGEMGKRGRKWWKCRKLGGNGSCDKILFCFVMPLPVALYIRAPRAALACFWGGGGLGLPIPNSFSRGGGVIQGGAQMK